MDKDELTQQMKDRLQEMGEITSKKMFGGVGFFLDSIMFAKLTGDNRVFLRVDDSNRADYEAFATAPFYADSKQPSPYYEVPSEILADDEQFLVWAQKAYAVAVANKK